MKIAFNEGYGITIWLRWPITYGGLKWPHGKTWPGRALIFRFRHRPHFICLPWLDNDP